MRPLVLALLLPGCVFVSRPSDCDAAADCIDLSMTLPGGEPDGCDLAACVACAAECGGDCLVLESYPPQYQCADGGASFDVYDTCPDWQPPPPTPGAEHVVDLGCGLSDQEDLLVVPTGADRVSVTHTDYADGCCPLSVDVSVDATDHALVVGYTPVDDFCDCICGLDVSYDLVGLTPGTWSLTAGTTPMTTTFTLP